MAKRLPYPLQWPDGFARTKSSDRRHSRFSDRGARPSPYEAAKGVLAELKLMHASHITITSTLPTRADGLPYADGRSDDPGIAVWAVMQGQERVFPCDVWHTHGENLRAIALSLNAMRGLERWGMAEVVQRTFAGFAALPAGGDAAPPPRLRVWREVLSGVDGPLAAAEWPVDMENDELLAIAKARHRRLVKQHHPDVGGNADLMAEINAALDAAEKELSS